MYRAIYNQFIAAHSEVTSSKARVPRGISACLLHKISFPPRSRPVVLALAGPILSGGVANDPVSQVHVMHGSEAFAYSKEKTDPVHNRLLS